jgi:hypothetical protein
MRLVSSVVHIIACTRQARDASWRVFYQPFKQAGMQVACKSRGTFTYTIYNLHTAVVQRGLCGPIPYVELESHGIGSV